MNDDVALDALAIRQVAVIAIVDPRTVKRWAEGKETKAIVAARIERAVKKWRKRNGG